MILAIQQREFLAEIAADDDLAPTSLGMAIYRNAYRGRLSDALAASFERTKAWVGAEAFEQASAHYILSHPPHSWTLDDYGADFPELLNDLFARDPEVAELAWLEWHMQKAFAAPHRPVLSAFDLAEASIAESEWAGLRFNMAPGFASRRVTHELAEFWQQLRPGASDARAARLPEDAHILVWRRDFSPHCRLIDPCEHAALAAFGAGQSFGSVSATIGEEGLERFGKWFADWLGMGLISSYVRAIPT